MDVPPIAIITSDNLNDYQQRVGLKIIDGSRHFQNHDIKCTMLLTVL